MSFLRDMVTRVWGEPVENLQPNVIVDPDNSTYIMHVNSDGSINAGIVSGEATSTAINDGTTTSQKAAVSAGGALKVDNSAVTQPVSATSLPLPSGAATSANQTTQATSLSNIDTSTSASKTDLDAINTILGAAGDSNSTNTHMGRLTKIRDYLAGLVYDNTDRLKVSLYGKNAAAADTALLVNSDGSVQSDIRKIAGSVISYSNPLINETSTLQSIRNAKAYNATTGKIAETTTKTIPFSIFNPNTAKNILILSLKVYMSGGSVVHEVRLSVTTDPGPAYTGAAQITPVNLDAGGAASSASVYTTTTSTSPTGTAFDSAEVASNSTFEFFGNGLGYLLPASANNGLVVFVQTSTATESYAVVARWLEW